jgi:hypothetical protein
MDWIIRLPIAWFLIKLIIWLFILRLTSIWLFESQINDFKFISDIRLYQILRFQSVQVLSSSFRDGHDVIQKVV